MNLTHHVKVVKVMNAVVAGTSNQDSSAVDMAGWDGVVFVCHLGTLTASQVTALEALGSDDNVSFAAYNPDQVTDDAADADSNKLLVLDLFRPSHRYIKARVERGTANAVINSVIAIQYRGDKLPAQLDSSISKLARFADNAAAPADVFTTYGN